MTLTPKVCFNKGDEQVPVVLKQGDIFTSTSQVIGHGVSTQGVMGSGIARTVRITYPSVFRAYREACEDGRLYGGQCLLVVADEHKDDEVRVIANIASQVCPGPYAKLHLLAEGLDNMFLQMEQLGLCSVSLPRIGTNTGGLNWDEVWYTIRETAKMHPEIDVEVWELTPSM